MRFILILILIASCEQIYSQQFTIGLEGGYAFKLASDDFVDGDVTLDNQNTQTNELIKYSFGQGLQFGGTLYYSISSKVEIGIGVNYLRGATFTKNINSPNTTQQRKYYARMLRLVPQVKFLILDRKYRVYSSIGIVAGLGSFYRVDKSDSSLSTSSKKFKYSEGISFGLNSALGIEYKTASNILWFLEIDIYTQSFGPRKRELISSSRDGVDNLDDFSVSEILIDYEDHYTNTNGEVPNPDLPTQTLRNFYPFSSVGVNVGVMIELFNED